MQVISIQRSFKRIRRPLLPIQRIWKMWNVIVCRFIKQIAEYAIADSTTIKNLR